MGVTRDTRIAIVTHRDLQSDCLRDHLESRHPHRDWSDIMSFFPSDSSAEIARSTTYITDAATEFPLR